VNGVNGEIEAHYQYDPFGNKIVTMGSMVDDNPFRFSTKYFDEESGFYYYGYRYYSPELGRWLCRDPSGEIAGVLLYGFVRNDSLNYWDWLGYNKSRTADIEYEKRFGLDAAIAGPNPTMKITDNIHGKTFSADNCMGKTGCKVNFKFEKAYAGIHTSSVYKVNLQGVYVKIAITIDDTTKCCCNEMNILQVTRVFEKNWRRGIVTDGPRHPTRRDRAGWGDSSAPSEGWYVDRLLSATNPYFDSGFSGNPGAFPLPPEPMTPAELFDAPGIYGGEKNYGNEYYTCAICNHNRKKKVLACLNWGYYIDKIPSVSFWPPTPSASCDTPKQFKDAVMRWNGISGNIDAGIEF
ncbi:MAG: RHS repeat domain-containing protein, partial [bacterium]